MPIAVKLSRKFYDAFGDDVVNELVEVLNQVDLAYRGTLKELNEANFARFDERLVRFGDELRAEMNAGFARADARLDREIAAVRADMQAGFAKTDTKFAELQAGFAKTDTKIANLRGELVKWMFLFWAGTALTVVGLLKS